MNKQYFWDENKKIGLSLEKYIDDWLKEIIDGGFGEAKMIVARKKK